MWGDKVLLEYITGEYTLVWGIRKEIEFKLKLGDNQRGQVRWVGRGGVYQAKHDSV